MPEPSFTLRQNLRDLLCVTLLSLTSAWIIFGSALWGQRLLAPVDIPFTLFAEFLEAKPDSLRASLPDNHYLIDQITYDVPVQWLAHKAISSGEFPWWSPHSFGGRPLAADAHANVFDPIRFVLYKLLPFVAAYNWTKILHGVFSALGAFFLLREFAPRRCSLALVLALTYQWCGPHATYFGHPWIQASFLYIPWLWLGVHRLRTNPSSIPGGLFTTFSCAGFLLAANLQSYPYLLLFGCAVLLGWPWRSPDSRRSLALLLLFATSGVLLAAIAWTHVLELFANSTRALGAPFRLRAILAAPLSALAAPLPWILGTHHTPDLSKLTGVYGIDSSLGFQLFCGTPLWAMTALSLFSRRNQSPPHLRSAWVLVWSYLLLIASPAGKIVYTRFAPLACLAMIVISHHFLLTREESDLRRLRRLLGLLCAAGFLFFTTATLFSHLPDSLHQRLLDLFLSMESRFAPGDPMLLLRKAQLQRIPGALGLSSLHMWGLSAVALVTLLPRIAPHKRELLLLAAGLLQVLLFTRTFVANQPLEWFEALMAAPRQTMAAAELKGKALRWVEASQKESNHLFPFEMEILYNTRSTSGYAALRPNDTPLQPETIFSNRAPMLVTDSPGEVATLIDESPSGNHYRFESQNPILAFKDSRYPGVELLPDGANRLLFRYHPSYRLLSLWLAGLALVILVALCGSLHASPRKNVPPPEPLP